MAQRLYTQDNNTQWTLHCRATEIPRKMRVRFPLFVKLKRCGCSHRENVRICIKLQALAISCHLHFVAGVNVYSQIPPLSVFHRFHWILLKMLNECFRRHIQLLFVSDEILIYFAQLLIPSRSANLKNFQSLKKSIWSRKWNAQKTKIEQGGTASRLTCESVVVFTVCKIIFLRLHYFKAIFCCGTSYLFDDIMLRTSWLIVTNDQW